MKTLILVGAGHSHLHIVREWKKEPIPDCRLVVISPHCYQYYSGMFSGYAEDLYQLSETRVPLIPFCRIAGVEFIEDTIIRVDAENNILYGSKEVSYIYDLVSFDIGSTVKTPDHFRNTSDTIKPNYLMPTVIESFRQSEFPVIVGAGAAGVEIAMSVQAWRKNKGLKQPIQIISSSPPMASEGEKVSKKVSKFLREREINVIEDDEAVSYSNNVLVTKSHGEIQCTQLLWLTGPSSFPLFEHSQLDQREGYLSVTSTLQSVVYSNMFGAGDCIDFTPLSKGLPKNGVHAVRQGPILWYNIQSWIMGRPLKSYIPPHQTLAILSLGQKQGLVLYKNRSFSGRVAWIWKNHIDQQFMNRYK